MPRAFALTMVETQDIFMGLSVPEIVCLKLEAVGLARSSELRLSGEYGMVQNHVGANYGTHFPLKPGVEVVLAFIDGDPDRPLIVGAVPNPIKPPPVTGVSPVVHRIRTSTWITVDMSE